MPMDAFDCGPALKQILAWFYNLIFIQKGTKNTSTIISEVTILGK